MATSGDLSWPPAGTFSWPWTGKTLQSLVAAIREDIQRRPEPVQRDLLTVEEVVDRLSLGLNSVCNLIRQGDLGSVKMGRARREAVRAVEAFLEHLTEVGEVSI